MRLALLLCLAGCASQSPRAITTAEGQRKLSAAEPQPRLGWVSWIDSETLYACDRRVDDAGNTIGVMGPCWRIGVDSVKHKVVSWINAEAPDRSPANATPWSDRCRVVLLPAQLAPPAHPARALLETATGTQTLDEWEPDAKLEADAGQLELTFDPDGKRLAIVRLAIALGEGERIIRIAGAKLTPLPSCDAPRD